MSPAAQGRSTSARSGVRALTPTRASGACLVALVATMCARSALAFTIAVDQVQAIGVYTALPPPPSDPVLDVQDPSQIAALIGGIEFGEELDCAPFGAAPEAVVFVQFADGALERYEILAGYEHLAKPGMPGSCYAIADASSAQFRTLTRVPPIGLPCGWLIPPLCNGLCQPGATCVPIGTMCVCVGTNP